VSGNAQSKPNRIPSSSSDGMVAMKGATQEEERNMKRQVESLNEGSPVQG
jgi:hypothetical protein